MPEPEQVVGGYLAAVTDPTEAKLASLEDYLNGDAVVVGPVGPGEGLAAIRHSLANPRMPGLVAGSTWSVRQIDDRAASVDIQLAPGKPMAGLVFHAAFDGHGRITRVEQQMLANPAPVASPLMLTDEIKDAVNGALANGTPVIVAYVDSEGAPHLSLRGSVQAFNDTELAIWVRDPEGGLVKALSTNPRLALFYRDPATRTSFQFAGRAQVDSDPQVRDAVYTNTPATERNLDARRLGVAVVVDLDRVEGMGRAGRFRMERSRPSAA